MRLGDLRPRPSLVLAKRTAEGKGKEIASRAVQVHGDVVTWRQEASDMEIDNISNTRTTRRMDSGQRIDHRYDHSLNVVNIGKNDYSNLNEVTTNEMRGIYDLGRIERKSNNIVSHNMMKWDVSKKGIEQAKKRATLAYERQVQSQVGSNYQLEEGEKYAGMTSGLDQKREAGSKRGSVQAAIVRNFGGPSPFARDCDDQNETTISKLERSRKVGASEAKSVTKSLSEVVKEKNSQRGPKSLRDLLEGSQ